MAGHVSIVTCSWHCMVQLPVFWAKVTLLWKALVIKPAGPIADLSVTVVQDTRH